ncbi:MAG TPA: hypothetical protein VJN63_02890 [Thermoplasmata archaeon]|nr:hypothetical protein [Thermoplasmata archaeon]
MASWLRPRNLAIVFGAYFAGTFLAAWWFTSSLTGPWYGIDTSRWVYAVYAIVAANFLVGVGTIAGIRASARDPLAAQVAGDGANVVDPPVVAKTGEPGSIAPPSDRGDKDIVRLLESLHDMGTSEAEEAEGLVHLSEDRSSNPTVEASSRSNAARAAPDVGKPSAMGLAGPAAAALAIVGVSAAMLPNAEGFLQSNYALNTTLVLGMSLWLVGLGVYLVATLLAPTSK